MNSTGLDSRGEGEAPAEPGWGGGWFGGSLTLPMGTVGGEGEAPAEPLGSREEGKAPAEPHTWL